MSQIQKNFSWLAVSVALTFIVLYFMFSVTWMGSVGALFAASAMAAIVLISGLINFGIQYQRTKNALEDKKKSGDDNMSVHQTRTIEIDLPSHLAFDIAMEALESLDGEDIPQTLTGIHSKQTLKIHKSDAEMGRIEAGLRAKTAGIQDFYDFSRINIQLQGLDSNTTRLQIESHPGNSLETFDLGRHTHYVNHLALYIRKASREQTAHDHLSDQQDNYDNLDNTTDTSSKELTDSE